MKFLKICFMLYLVLTLIIPIQMLAAEEHGQYMAKSEAERAADRDVNKACWLGAGMTVVGAGIAMIWNSSSPDPSEFAGKSPEYIRAYTDAYRSRVKSRQTIYSCIGCGFTLTMAGCAIAAIEINEGCQDWTDENCLPQSCYSSSEEESSCITGSSCGSGDDGSSCGSGDDGSSCSSGSDGGSSCGSGSGG